MDSLKRAIKFQCIDFIKAVGWFWLVMLIINIASYISLYKFGANFIGLRVSGFGNVDGLNTWFLSIAASNLMAIIIFLIVYCYEMYYEYFPVAINFSVTRKDFYLSAIVDNIFISLIFSVIQGILMKVDYIIINLLGNDPKVDFRIFNNATDNIFFIIFSLFVSFLVFISIINLLAAFNYKLGYKLWIIFGVIFVVAESFIDMYLIKLFENLFITRISGIKLIILMIIIIACYAIGYMIINITNVKNKLV